MNISFLDPKVNPFQTSEIRRIQDFYGIRYEDLWKEEILKKYWLKPEEIKYCLDNKDKEFALKSTEWFELREWVLTTERFKKLQEFYGFSLKDTQDIETLRKFKISDDDIEFITWRDLSNKEETKWDNNIETTKQNETITPKKKIWRK